ncbi:Amine oxidase domain-containing protein [Rozella allomycis CSF55]|uniref:monoamine oxidase n=1 Tax=Rozella allomycis (strain CSF55) TaxID=988480 RepID=A0A075B0N1_ROZAC|nr:Amine oxidase domain-containing protein [Rozella allomycis CSF55]|eukprot:EPZ36084.1 Amine oxidase domain-containing protein [Rozella allomycis CSF55]
MPEKNIETDVLIVGAGLFAAMELQKLGQKIFVVEAINRIGGRLLSYPVNGTGVDLGGMWIDEGHQNTLDLVTAAGLTKIPQYNEGNDIVFTKDESHYSNDSSYKFDTAEVEENILTTNYEEGITNEFKTSRDLASHSDSRTHAMFDYFVRSSLCCEPSEISAQYLLEDVISGNRPGVGNTQYRIREGAQELCKYLQKQLNDTIKFNWTVTNIYINEKGGCHVSCIINNSTMITIKCKYVVLAIPPTAIAKIQFNPSIPSNKYQLIQKSFMGFVIKIHVIYRRAFWRKNGLSGNAHCVVSEEDLNKSNNLDNSNPSFAITTVVDGCDDNMKVCALVIFSCGIQARNFSSIPKDQRKPWITSALSKLFGPEAEQAIGYQEKDWSLEHTIGGGYQSLLGPGSTHLGTEKGSYYESISSSHKHIHFAGTEAAFNNRGYIEGAIESGKRVAKEIKVSLQHSGKPFMELPQPIIDDTLGNVSRPKIEKKESKENKNRLNKSKSGKFWLGVAAIGAAVLTSMIIISKRK